MLNKETTPSRPNFQPFLITPFFHFCFGQNSFITQILFRLNYKTGSVLNKQDKIKITHSTKNNTHYAQVKHLLISWNLIKTKWRLISEVYRFGTKMTTKLVREKGVQLTSIWSGCYKHHLCMDICRWKFLIQIFSHDDTHSSECLILAQSKTTQYVIGKLLLNLCWSAAITQQNHSSGNTEPE